MAKLSTLVKKARTSSGGHGDHLVIEALAGTGKTTTEIVGVAWIYRKKAPALWAQVKKKIGFDPEKTATPQQMAIWEAMAEPYGRQDLPRTITYVAFNKSIVLDFDRKFSWMVKAMKEIGVSLSFSTCHSLGFSAVRKAYELKPYGSVNQWKTRDLMEKLLRTTTRELFQTPKGAALVKATEELVKHCKTSLVEPSPDALERLAAHYTIEVQEPEKVHQLVPAILEASRTDIQEVDFADQLWLPVAEDLPVFVSDLLIGDEAQDWNPAQQRLLLKAARRAVVCGDTYQAIYGFTGADVDSIANMSSKLAESRPVKTLTLTVTRRCAKAIVREAQKIVPQFEAHPENSEGQVLHVQGDEAWKMIGEKDMMVGRTNAPLVSWAFRLIKAGKKANIQGRDIGTGLIKLIDQIMGKGRKRKTVSDLVDGLESWFDKEAQKMAKRKRPDEAAQIALKDRRDCLMAFTEGADSLAEVKASIKRTFQGMLCPTCKKSYDEGTRVCYAKGCSKVALVKPQGTLLSSIHRAKGMEAQTVFLIHPELIPHPMAKTAWAQGQEVNLEYVAKTRAIETLVIVETEEGGE